MNNKATTQQQIIQENKKENKRLIGLDILKILSIFFILVHHFSKHGEFYANTTGFTQTLLSILNVLFLPSVNIFVFISAYLIIKKNSFNLKRFLFLYLEIVFYSILTYLFSLIITKESFDIKTIISAFDPFNNVFWFTNAYMLMYALSPFLLIIINKLKKNGYLVLIFVLMIVVIISTYSNLFPVLANGFNFMWFVFLFLFAGFQAKFGFNLKKWIWILIYAISFVILYLIFSQTVVATPIYTSISVIISTFALFNIFLDIEIKNTTFTKITTFVSSSILGVYLLHDGKHIQKILYSKIIKTHNVYLRPTSILWFLLFVIATFIVCLIIDLTRRYICKAFFKIIEKQKANKKIKKDTV